MDIPNHRINPFSKTKVSKTVIMLGSFGVGKTNILLRYIKKKFDESYKETIGNEINLKIILGVDYYSKEITSLKFGSLVLNLWDTCGSETDVKILPSNIYKVTSAYVIVCSYDNKESFEMLGKWIDHVTNYISGNFRTNYYLIPILVLINKCDIKKERKFKLCDVIKIVDQYDLNIVVYEISAKENIKIDYVFEKIVAYLSGKLSLTDTTQNTTHDGGNSVGENSFRKRTRSFQLKNDNFNDDRGDIDKGFNKQGSCC